MHNPDSFVFLYPTLMWYFRHGSSSDIAAILENTVDVTANAVAIIAYREAAIA